MCQILTACMVTDVTSHTEIIPRNTENLEIVGFITYVSIITS